LLDGNVDVATFSNERRFAPDAEALLQRTEYRHDTSIEPTFDKMHVDVEVTLTDGRVVSARCNSPDGSWSRPVARARIEQKARGLLRQARDAATVDRFMAAANAPAEGLKVRDLMALLNVAGARCG
jgi:aconitate decarboxylase